MDRSAGSLVLQWNAFVETVRVDEFLQRLDLLRLQEQDDAVGRLGASILTRDLHDGRTEVCVLSTWRDEASMRAVLREAAEDRWPDEGEYLLAMPAPALEWRER